MALTPEEQAFSDRLTGDNAAQAAHKDFTAPSQASFLDMAKASGADVPKIQKQIADEEAKANQDIATSDMGNNGLPQATQGDLGGAIKGAGQGMAMLVERAANFGIDLVDSAENFAASQGLGKGDLITSSSQIDWASKLQSPEDSVTTRAARNITMYAAPVLATMGAGAGVAAGLGAGALTDLLLLDPKQERLSTVLRDNVPELKNYPPVYAMASMLANNPGDGNLEGRLKNMVEGTLTAGLTIGAFKGLGALTSKVIEGAGYAKNVFRGKPASTAADIATSLETKAVPIATEEQLAANEAKISPPANIADPIIETPAIAAAPGVAPVAAKASFNPQNDSVVNFAKEFAQANPQDLNKIFSEARGASVVSPEVLAMKNNPEEVKKLLAWTRADGPLTDAQTKLAHSIMYDVHDSVVSAAARAVDSKAPEDLLHLSEMLDTFKYVANVETGAGAEASRALSSNKMGADLLNISHEEYLKILSKEHKAELVKDLVNAHGGQDNLQELAKNIKAIQELTPAQAAGRVSLKDAVPLTGFQRTSKFIQSIAINGMLSSLTTPASNITSNALVNANTMMEHYLAAGVGKLRGWGNKDVVTMASANGYIRGQMGAFFEGLTAAGSALRTGKGGPANVLKGDLVLQGAVDVADGHQNLANKILGKIVEGTGLAVGLPSRINATADAFFGTILYRGKQYERAVTDAEKLGLKGQELASYIQNRISNVTVAEHTANSEFAQANTFSKALDPKSFSGRADQLIGTIPMGRVIFPFFKTTANIAQYSIEHSPLSLALGSTREAVLRGGKDGDIAIAKMILGSSMVGGAAYLASQGIITGPDTQNPSVKRALEESGTGWQPDSIKIGDHYVGYNRIDPFNSVLRLGAVISSLANYTSEDDYQQIASMAGAAVMDFMTPEMMVDGYSRFFQAYNEASKYGDKNKVAAVAADIANRFVPFSAMQRDIKNQVDPTKRSMAIENGQWLNQFTDRIIARYKSNSPFFSADLPPVRNMFGDPLHPPDGVGPDMISPFTITSSDGSQLSAQLAKLTGFKEQMAPNDPEYTPLNLEMPPKVISFAGQRLELNPQQYDKFVMYSAGLNEDGSPLSGESGTLKSKLTAQLKAMGNVPNEMSPRQYHAYLGRISATVMHFRQMGEARLMKDPDLREKFYRAQKAANTKQTIDAFQ